MASLFAGQLAMKQNVVASFGTVEIGRRGILGACQPQRNIFFHPPFFVLIYAGD